MRFDMKFLVLVLMSVVLFIGCEIDETYEKATDETSFKLPERFILVSSEFRWRRNDVVIIRDTETRKEFILVDGRSGHTLLCPLDKERE